jgi:cullin-4
MSSTQATQADKKRKHSDRTIKELFTSQHKPHVSGTAPLSPSSKRPKLASASASSPAEAATTSTPEPAMSTASMYHFPSKRAEPEVIDLGSSPDNSPARKTGFRKATPNLSANTGPKKLLVKNFRPTRSVDPKAFLDQTWRKVDAALDTIFQQGTINFSLEELYRGVENICRQGMAVEAKKRLVAKCKTYVSGPLKQRVEDVLERHNVEVLRAALQAWATWNEQLVCRG